MRCLVVLSALMLGCVQPQPSYSGGSSSSSSEPSGGCHKGKRCGDSCIAHSKTCHGGSTYKKRRK